MSQNSEQLKKVAARMHNIFLKSDEPRGSPAACGLTAHLRLKPNNSYKHFRDTLVTFFLMPGSHEKYASNRAALCLQSFLRIHYKHFRDTLVTFFLMPGRSEKYARSYGNTLFAIFSSNPSQTFSHPFLQLFVTAGLKQE